MLGAGESFPKCFDCPNPHPHHVSVCKHQTLNRHTRHKDLYTRLVNIKNQSYDLHLLKNWVSIEIWKWSNKRESIHSKNESPGSPDSADNL